MPEFFFCGRLCLSCDLLWEHAPELVLKHTPELVLLWMHAPANAAASADWSD